MTDWHTYQLVPSRGISETAEKGRIASCNEKESRPPLPICCPRRGFLFEWLKTHTRVFWRRSREPITRAPNCPAAEANALSFRITAYLAPLRRGLFFLGGRCPGGGRMNSGTAAWLYFPS